MQISASPTPEQEAEPVSAVLRARHAIRTMIYNGEVMPGQQLRQETLADEIGLSRAPIREALHALLAEGVVTHQRHIGYSVTRLSQFELSQIYLMREILEAEIYKTAELPAPAEFIANVTDLNAQMKQACDDRDYLRYQTLNHQFHFAIFDRSSLAFVIAEVKRLWDLSRPYRTMYLYDAVASEGVIAQHNLMIEALSRSDPKSLIYAAANHRAAAESAVGALLTRPSGAGDLGSGLSA